MNSRERVLRAIRREKTDRAATYFRAEAVTLEKIRRETGLSAAAFMDAIDADIRHIDAVAPPERDMGGFFENYWGERYVYHDSQYGPVRDDMEGALASAQTLEELTAFPWVKNDDMDHSHLAAQCSACAGRAILYGSGDVWQRPGLVRGMGNFLVDMYEHPDYCHYLSGLFTDFYVEDYRRAFEASGRRIDIFLIYSDLGTQRAPLISLDMLREFVVPYLSRIAAAIHEMGAAFFFHSCGMIAPFIPELIECGVDILDPIQPCGGAEAMQPESLQKNFGDRLCFNGGIDIQGVLINGSPADVRAEVMRYRRAFDDTGYICCPTHLFQADTPVANIRALYEAANAEL